MSKKKITVWTNENPTPHIIHRGDTVTLNLSTQFLLTYDELASGEWRDLIIQQITHGLPGIVKVVRP
jgi:hypothetical protein